MKIKNIVHLMSKTLFTSLLLVIPIVGCHDNKKENNLTGNEEVGNIQTLRIENLTPSNAFPWSDILDPEMEIIKLETNNNSLIAELTKIQVTENNILIYDRMQKNILVFDRNGKFRFKLLRGKGPEEIREPRDFVIDNNSIIHVLSYHEVVQFNLKGEYLNRVHFNYTRNSEYGYSNPTQFGVTKDGYYLWGGTFARSNFDTQSVFLMYQTGEKLNILKKYFKADRDLLEYTRFYINNNKYFLKPTMTSDTIYMADDEGKVEANYILDFGGKSVQSNLQFLNNKTECTIYQEADKYDLCITREILHSKKYLLFQYGCNKRGYQVLYDRSSQKLVNGRSSLDSQFIDYISIGSVSGDDLIFVFLPIQLIDRYETLDHSMINELPDYQKLILKTTRTLEESDNPIICISSINLLSGAIF